VLRAAGQQQDLAADALGLGFRWLHAAGLDALRATNGAA
jgi:hypothetical protein